MLNQFYLQREILSRIQKIQQLCRACRLGVSLKVKAKAQQLHVDIPEQIQIKMTTNPEDASKKTFQCRFCNKVFNEGRKLGGHISRAHPAHKVKEEMKGELKLQNTAEKERIKQEEASSFSSSEYMLEDDEEEHAPFYNSKKERKIKKQQRCRRDTGRFYIKRETANQADDEILEEEESQF